MIVFKIIFWAGTVMQIIIRTPFALSVRQKKKAEHHVSSTENILLVLLTIAAGILPLIYSVTNWLAFVDYSLPAVRHVSADDTCEKITARRALTV